MKDIANPEETFEEKTVERPNSCAIRMPEELYKLLNWQSNDGLNWTYIDQDRVLLQRIPAEHGEEGEPIPDGTFQPVEPDVAPTPKTKGYVPTEEELRSERVTQEQYRKKAIDNPTPVMTQEEIDAMVAQSPIDAGDASKKEFTDVKKSDVPSFELPVDHMTSEGEELPSDDEIREHKKRMIEKYSTTVIDDEGNEKEVLRYEPEGGLKKGTPEYEFERKRVKKKGIPPQPKDGGVDADDQESE